MIVETADLRSRLPVYQHAEARAMFEQDARRQLLRLEFSRLSLSQRDALSERLREALGKPDSEHRAATLDLLTTQTRRAMR